MRPPAARIAAVGALGRPPKAPIDDDFVRHLIARRPPAGAARRLRFGLRWLPWSAHGDSGDASVEVELRGLSIYTHHGVTDAEQEVGQRLEFDLTFDVPDCDAVLTDRVEDTVDYAEVCDIVALAATERSYRTLERLCQVVAERLMERFDCEAVRVRAAKPEPPLPYPVNEAAVEVTLERAPTASRTTTRRALTEPARTERIGYLGLGSNVGDRERHLRRRRRPARARRRGRGRLVRSTRPSRSARSSTSPTS